MSDQEGDEIADVTPPEETTQEETGADGVERADEQGLPDEPADEVPADALDQPDLATDEEEGGDMNLEIPTVDQNDPVEGLYGHAEAGNPQAPGEEQVTRKDRPSKRPSVAVDLTDEPGSPIGQEEVDDEEEVEKEIKSEEQQQIDVEQSAVEEVETEQEPKSVEEGEIGEDEIPKIPDDFFYNNDEYTSKAVISEDSGLPSDVLSLYHSFGYDCTKRSNLYLLDMNTLIFAAGNITQMMNIKTKEQKYLRTSGGGGVGAVAVHPHKTYFAVAEKGEMPDIMVYEYPSLKLYRILKEGTEEAYSFIDFNSGGNLLVSLGSNPDFMMTIWDWGQEQIVLRAKAFSQDIFRVTFSPDNEGQLTTSGVSHIRFWKMADTFTGLKLQGQIGRFGKTELSDIESYMELPDGKVLSSCESGNMLLWEGGLIKVQICRRGKKACHTGSVQQFVMDEGELLTLGTDGYVRVWDFETIDTADTIDDTGLYEMEPMNELRVGQGDVFLKSMVKSLDPDDSGIWYAQDANGAIWRVDLSFSHTTKDPERLFSYHAGEICDLTTSPKTNIIATIGVDKSVRVFDCINKQQICESHFSMSGSVIAWAPEKVDQKFSTLIAGFQDGVVRLLTLAVREQDLLKKATPEYEMTLKEVFKPHSDRVAALAFDSKSKMLASVGDDMTLFFFNIEDKFQPIGFIDIPSPVSNIQWVPHNKDTEKLICFCSNGEVHEYIPPQSSQIDSSKTFKIESLTSRSFVFKSIKSKLKKAEEKAKKEKEREAKRKQREKEKRLRRARGIEDDEEEKADDDLDDVVEDDEFHAPEEPSPLLNGFYYGQPNKFWLSMGGFDTGYLYECKFADNEIEAMKDKYGEPDRAVQLSDCQGVAVNSLQFSTSGKQLLMGLQNGGVRVQFLTPDPDSGRDEITQSDHYWRLPMHDGQYGNVTRIRMSSDGNFVFSVGGDGNFFVYQLMSQKDIDQAVADAKILSPRSLDSTVVVEDIEDPKAYSIEEAKQKSEYDRLMKLAEEKKQTVKRDIARMRRQFKKLLVKNEDLPEHLQLDRREFEIDPQMKRDILSQTDERMELVKKEMAWETEKHNISLRKLQDRFKAQLENDRVVVKAFQSPHEVAAFRLQKLGEHFFKLKNEARSRKISTRMSTLHRTPTLDQINLESPAETKVEQRADSPPKTAPSGGQVADKAAKALGKVEQARRKRMARKKQWDELFAKKPSDNYEDPEDVAAIKEAMDNMGDFRLKTAKDYVVPEHLRMNASKKLYQLLHLQELIYNYKKKFNVRLISIRDKKIRIITQIKDIIHDIRVIHGKLPQSGCQPLPTVPILHTSETPEKKFEFTRETLLKFKKELAEKQEAELKGSPSGGGGFGFGGFGGGGGGGTGTNDGQVSANHSKPSSAASRIKHSGLSMATVDSSNIVIDVTGGELSPLEQALNQAEEIRLQHDQEMLYKKIDVLLKTFDTELRTLRKEKMSVEIQLKNADLRLVTLFEELLLLKEFEKREDILAGKVNMKMQEKLDMEFKVAECQMKIDKKRVDMERQQEKEKGIHLEFVTSLGDNNKWAEFLIRVFKKKIKRTKKKVAREGDDDDEDDSDESDSDESDWSSEEGSEEGEEVLDDSVCPPGCEQELFDLACQLRERRLDMEELISEEKKLSDTLKKEFENLSKKVKVIDGALKTAENDLEAFQLEKQQKLNELDVVVTLKLHQIQYMVNNVLPQDLSQTLVFHANGLVRLQQRIKELHHEKSEQRSKYKDNRQQHVQLIKDKRFLEGKVKEWRDKCEQVMMLKFGRIVDLEKLETVGVDRNVEELKEKLRQNELRCNSDIEIWELRLEERRDRITELIRDNTEKLEQYTMLLEEQKSLEIFLDSKQKNLGGEYEGRRKADVRERQRLIQLVQLQAQEVEALKEEITLLSRKGGHILPPAQPPMPVPPQPM